MKLSVVQFSPELENKENNLKKIEHYSRLKSDIIIFPELATSGYFFTTASEIKKMAEPFEGEAVTRVQKIAESENKIIVFGFPEKANKKIYNSAAILFPDKKLSRVYRKTHLFYKEFQIFTPGDTGFFNIFYPDFDLNLGTMICYDWRFPEAARTLALKGADLIVCPSNLVTDVWHIAMPARALENKVYLAVANRTGKEKRNGEELIFKGASAIYSYNGGEMIKADCDEEAVLTVDIASNKTRDKSFNDFNDIFKDRKPEMYVVD